MRTEIQTLGDGVNRGVPISIRSGFEKLTFAPERRPDSSDIQAAFCTLASYREGGIFLGHFAGESAWERHTAGDELLFVVEGETDLRLLIDGVEQRQHVCAGELIVVPEGAWHKFHTDGVKLIAVTPQPSDHQIEHPGAAD
ncbi:MAG: cupin domain-containing protein [Pseudomonadota bacterium]